MYRTAEREFIYYVPTYIHMNIDIEDRIEYSMRLSKATPVQSGSLQRKPIQFTLF